MSDQSFSTAVAYVLGTRQDVIGLHCPSCAAERMAATVITSSQEIRYVETVKQCGPTAPCVACAKFPLVLPAQEQLEPRKLVAFIGRVLRMAERAESESSR